MTLFDLTKITTPFGLLDKETQKALKAHGGPYEYWAGMDGWFDAYPPRWADACIYRVKPQPLTKPSINWSHVAPQYKWLAQHKDGCGGIFIFKPRTSGWGWSDGNIFAKAKDFASYTPGTCDWRDSLVERPEGV